MTTTTQAPWAIDPDRINPRAVRLVEAFRAAVVRMRDEDGFTFADLVAAATMLEQIHDTRGTRLISLAVMMLGPVFQTGGDGYTISDELDSPTYVPGAPIIDNPGVLPMRPDEPGTPLIASGRVLDGHGRPLAGAEMEIYHASNDGFYSGQGDDQPKYNLRARQITDAEGRYAFTTVTPAPYLGIDVMPAPDHLADAAAILGRSLFRPAHIHYEIHHPDLLKPWRGEIYFSGDPVIDLDVVGPGTAAPSLQADMVRHEDPQDIAAHGFDGPYHTAVFDFIVKTRTSPEVALAAPVTG